LTISEYWLTSIDYLQAGVAHWKTTPMCLKMFTNSHQFIVDKLPILVFILPFISLTIFYLGLCITTLRGDWKEFLAENAPITPHVFIDEYCAIGPKDMGHFSKNHCEFKSFVERIPSDYYCWISLDFWQGFESTSELLPYIKLEDAKTTILTTVQRCTHSIFNEFKENYDPSLTNIGHQYQGLPCEQVSIVSNDGEGKTQVWKRMIRETIAKEKANGWTDKQIVTLIVRPILCFDDNHTTALKKRLKKEENITSYFDYEVLSQEWPVVIICLPSKEYKDLAIVQSRAIAKIIYILGEPSNGIEKISPIRIPTWSRSCLILRKRIDVLTYHQELHTNEKLQEAETLSTFLQLTKALIKTLEEENRSVVWLIGKDFHMEAVRREICILGKDAGIVYKSFRIKMNQEIWNFWSYKTNPQNKYFEHRRTKQIHDMNLLNTVRICKS